MGGPLKRPYSETTTHAVFPYRYFLFLLLCYPNPYDNAQAEAGWSTLKTELIPGNAPFASLEEARLEIAWYLGFYFNLARRHSALGYRSPNQFEYDLKSNLS